MFARRVPPRAKLAPHTSAFRRASSAAAGQAETPFDSAKLLLKASVFLAGSTLAYFYVSDTRASIWKYAVMPAIHKCMDAEESHKWSIYLAKKGLAPMEKHDPDAQDHRLETKLWGKTFNNPVGLAAGYDKHAEAIDSLLGFGFGFVEIGSVTPKPQDGNPKPRMFRLEEDQAVINRYGFNSEGHSAVAERLKSRIRSYLYSNKSTLTLQGSEVNSEEKEAYGLAPPSNIPRSLVEGRNLGVNLGKNKISAPESNADYVDGVINLGPFADYIVVNVSSPNTPGLRALQRREPMQKLMEEVKNARDKNLPHRPPLLVKIAPDVSDTELEDIAAIVKSVGIDGIIISNTTISRPDSLKSDQKLKREFGGLSGPPVLPLALDKVSKFYKLTSGTVPIIGCGGISSAQDALAFGKAGASLVQLYTGLGYHGPGIVGDIKEGLVQLLKAEGKTWKDIVGSNHK